MEKPGHLIQLGHLVTIIHEEAMRLLQDPHSASILTALLLERILRTKLNRHVADRIARMADALAPSACRTGTPSRRIRPPEQSSNTRAQPIGEIVRARVGHRVTSTRHDRAPSPATAIRTGRNRWMTLICVRV